MRKLCVNASSKTVDADTCTKLSTAVFSKVGDEEGAFVYEDSCIRNTRNCPISDIVRSWVGWEVIDSENLHSLIGPEMD